MRRLEQKKNCRKWHGRYLDLARLVSTWSKHPDVQVGAVAIGSYGQVLSTGYNGWPRNVINEEEGHARNQRPSLTIHAEANVIYNATLTRVSLEGSSVYVYPLFPCVECAKALVQVGVGQICFSDHDMTEDERVPDAMSMMPNWKQSWVMAFQLFRDAGVEVVTL